MAARYAVSRSTPGRLYLVNETWCECPGFQFRGQCWHRKQYDAEAGMTVAEPEVKECRRCKQSKPLAEMKRDTRYGDGHSSFCRACHQAASVAWQKANPDRVKEARRARYAALSPEERRERNRAKYDPQRETWAAMRRRYRLSREQFEALLAAQGGGCALCGTKPSVSTRRFAVDHDHDCCPAAPTCGACTRGILCGPCNLALHQFAGRPGWQSRLAAYLKGASDGVRHRS